MCDVDDNGGCSGGNAVVVAAAVADDADVFDTVVSSMDDGTWFTILLSATSDGCLYQKQSHKSIKIK